ncbi:D-hexose-6-phosphate mutarotase [Ghiorsea bivora]|uniref:D-hexose-6-phosphate mutarotase n=1 Tax=Ghiorsea bivora TaxID=1485545 RepID=UPI00056F4084|nr:D-hexose-6-phosphate mutarotase [Ghiorsea bivora]
MPQSLQALQQCISDKYTQVRVSEYGLNILDINTKLCSASMALQGAHVMTWQPKGEAPVLWLSPDAKLEKGKSIRGGIPICWPWFGDHETESTYAAHGFARTADWELISTAELSGGEIEVVMHLSDTRTPQWAYDTPAEIKVVFGHRLTITLTTTNQSKSSIQLSEALHTYFQIQDVRDIEIHGLDGCECLDKLQAYQRQTQQGTVQFSGEVDRIYIHQTQDIMIQDKALQRSIRITKQGSQSSIVWNPWLDKCKAMGDLGGDNAFLNMVCVESGNAAENTVALEAGEAHRVSVTYSIA